jgi:hypothetical protein
MGFRRRVKAFELAMVGLPDEVHLSFAGGRLWGGADARPPGGDNSVPDNNAPAEAEPAAFQPQKPPTGRFLLRTDCLAAAFGRALEALPEEVLGLGLLEHRPRAPVHNEGMRATDPACQLKRYAGTEGEGLLLGRHAANAVRAATRTS